MEIKRTDNRVPSQLRKIVFKRNILNQPHGSVRCSQGATDVIVSVKGPLAGTKKNENPEKACIDVIWKPRTGEKGKVEKEYEMILKRTLQSICILTMNPNTTTTVQVKVIHDDGALLPCAINAACAALVDAGIPLKHLAVAVCCCLGENGSVLLDPTKQEEEEIKVLVHLVSPNRYQSVLPKESLQVNGEPMEHGIITSITHGPMSVDDYLRCLERGRAAAAYITEEFRRQFSEQLLQ